MEDNLTAFTKMRGSLNPNEEVVFYWTGNIYDIQDADPLGAPLNDYPGPIADLKDSISPGLSRSQVAFG